MPHSTVSPSYRREPTGYLTLPESTMACTGIQKDISPPPISVAFSPSSSFLPQLAVYHRSTSCLSQSSTNEPPESPNAMTSTLQSITNAIPSLGRARLLINSSDDVVIVSAVRTAITKVGFGFSSQSDRYSRRGPKA